MYFFNKMIEPLVLGKRSRTLIPYSKDYPEVHELLEDYGYTIHIRLRGEHRVNCKRIPRYRARHWIVERTHSWMNRFRRLFIRWEKKVENYVAMLHIACTFITYRAEGLFV